MGGAYSIDLIAWRRLAVCSWNVVILIYSVHTVGQMIILLFRNIYTLFSKQVCENAQTNQVEDYILIKYQILETYLQGNV